MDREEMLLEINSRYDGGGVDEANDRMAAMADHMEKVADAGDEAGGSAEKAGGGFMSMVGGITAAIGALGLITAALGLFSGAVGGVLELESAMNLVEAQTGLTGSALAEFQVSAQELYTGGLGDGIGDVTQAMAQVRNITQAGGEELQNMTQNALVMRDVFGSDVIESTRAADTMMEHFGGTSEETFDLLTRGMQLTGDPAGDLLDTFNEYSGNFAEMGLSAEQTLAIINSGLQGGARNTDDIADAMREFQIRMKENPQILEESFAGMDDGGFFEDVAAGFNADGANGLAFALDMLREMEDPVQRNAAGVALFGTKWEDMGEQAFLAMDMTTGQLGDVEGATDSAGAALQQGMGPALERLKRTGMTLLTNFLTPYVMQLADKAIPIMEEFGAWLETDGVVLLEEFGTQLGIAAEHLTPIIEGIIEFMGSLSAESIMIIVGALAIMTGPAIVAGMMALAGGAASAALAFAPLLAVMALVVAYESDFGGLRTSITDFGNAVREGDAAGAVQALANALIAIPKGIATELGDLVGLDVESGLESWSTFGDSLTTIADNAGALPGVLGDMLLEGIGIDPEVAKNAVQTKIIDPIFNGLSQIIGGDTEGGLNTIGGALSDLFFSGLEMIGIDPEAAKLLINEKIITPIQTVLQTLFGGGEDGENPIKAAVSGFGETILSALGENLPDFATWVMDNVITPITDAVSGLIDLFKGAINSAVPNDFGFQVRVDLPSPLPDIDEWVGASLPDPFPGYAGGGSFMAGQTMLVGERGAEVVQFGTSGRVIPNQLAFAGGSGGGGSTGADAPVVMQPVQLVLDGKVIYEAVEKVRRSRS